MRADPAEPVGPIREPQRLDVGVQLPGIVFCTSAWATGIRSVICASIQTKRRRGCFERITAEVLEFLDGVWRRDAEAAAADGTMGA